MKDNTYKFIQCTMNDINHSSLININNSYYMFNCPDGTQRNMIEHDVKFNKVNSIFFTDNSSEMINGFYGFSMSRWEQVSGILLGHEETEKKDKKKSNVSVPKALQLYGPNGFSENFKYSEDFYMEEPLSNVFETTSKNNKEVIFREVLTNNEIPCFQDNNVSIHPIINSNAKFTSYCITPSERKRPFLPLRAKELGVKDPKDLGKLNTGKSVMIGDVEITPDDVLGPIPKRYVLLLLRITNEKDFLLLLENILIQNLLMKKDNKEIAYCIYLIDDVKLLTSENYLIFSNKLDSTIKQIVDCKTVNKQILLNEGKIKISKITNSIAPDFYSLSSLKNITTNSDEAYLSNKLNEKQFIIATPGLELSFNNPEKINVDEFTFKNIDKLDKKISDNIKIKFENKNTEHKIFNEPSICILGSSSQKPCIHRNVSAILIEVNDSYLILDSGEGTFQQLAHLYNTKHKSLQEILSKIRLIYITHKHGDHFIGILTLLTKIYESREQLGLNGKEEYKTYIICPRTLKQWIENNISINFNQLGIINHQFIILDCQNLNPETENYYSIDTDKELIDIERKSKDEIEIRKNNFIKKIQESIQNDIYYFYKYINDLIGINVFSVEVLHCNDAYGVIIEEQNKNWKISYSGDTRPCNNFYNYCQYSTVLIHEATFDNELEEDAKKKRHSTFSNAIEMGDTCWRVVLTHFSPRYSKFVPYNKLFDESKALVVFDGIQFKLGELENLYQINKMINDFMLLIEKENIL